MSDRTYTTKTNTINGAHQRVAALPMPGRLLVEHYDNLLRKRVAGPLSKETAGTPVSATGRITKIHHLDASPGRVNVVLVSDDGNSAIVTFAPEKVARIEPLLREGTRITLGGLVTRTMPTLPAGIEGFNAQLAEA